MQTFARIPAFIVHMGALDAALRAALGAKMIGLSTYAGRLDISIFLTDSADSVADVATMDAVLAAHDPVFVSADKMTIAANNTDAATLTIGAPNPKAAPVTLLVAGQPVAVTLVNGVGTVVITAPAPGLIAVSVQNPSNRTTDSDVIQGI